MLQSHSIYSIRTVFFATKYVLPEILQFHDVLSAAGSGNWWIIGTVFILKIEKNTTVRANAF